MKRIFTLILSAFSLTAMAQLPFTANSIVVYRVGDGAATLRSVSAQVYLDEYSATGTLLQSIPMPTTASGSNAALTASGSATAEGLINRSVDGRYLVITGYNTDTGYAGVATSTATAVKRVVGLVNASATINTSTQLGTSAFSGNGIRSAVTVDGSRLWMAGAGTGIRTALVGDSSTRVTSATTTSNFRGLGIYNGQLYASTTSGTVNRLVTVGTGLPIDTGTAVTAFNGFPITGYAPNQFFMADLNPNIPGVDVIYVADEGSAPNGGVQKYSFDGTAWISNGLIAPSTSGSRGLTGSVNGGIVGLAVATPSKLYTLIDVTGHNGTITGATFTEIASAPANTAFRGVAISPIPGVTPLKLVSFNAALSANGAALNWTSANEVNVNNFIIERSADSKNFSAIGTVAAQNRSEATYTFTDRKPIEGIGYYRLKMLDKDGSFSYSSVAMVINRKGFAVEVFPNPAINKLTINHTKAVKGATVTILGANGEVLKTQVVSNDAVQTNVAVDKLPVGNYVVVFNNDGVKSVVKFVKQ